MMPAGAAVLGIILARGGSKGIPRKNVQPAGGKPLIAWTIEAGLRSGALARLIVSTDNDEIAAVSREWGAEVPFQRPAALAQDDTGSIETTIHAVEFMADRHDYRPEYVLLLQPTSPLRTAEDIKGAVRLARERQADGVVSVTAAHSHPYWMKTIGEDGVLRDFLKPERPYTRRQDLPPVYFIDGALYLVRRDVLLERRTFYTDRTYAYVMPADKTLDVDSPWDLMVADLVLRARDNEQQTGGRYE